MQQDLLQDLEPMQVARLRENLQVFDFQLNEED